MPEKGFGIADLLHPKQREYSPATIGGDSRRQSHIGRNCAQKLLKELKLQGPPIILNSVASYLMVEITYVDQADGNTWGQYLGGRVIEIAKGLSANEHRSTLAHELGHVALNHATRHRWDTLDNMNSPDPHEQEAWDFARELLMPTDMLKKEYKINSDPDYLARKFLVSRDFLVVTMYKRNLV